MLEVKPAKTCSRLHTAGALLVDGITMSVFLVAIWKLDHHSNFQSK